MRNKNYYPVFLDLSSKPVLVAGGGTVAERKIDGLLQAGALVTVVSPQITDEIHELVANNLIKWVSRQYRPDDLQGIKLVIAATDNEQVNSEVFFNAQNLNIPVNVVDDPPHCSFIVPALVRKGDITVAVSTGGAAPAIAARIRNKIAQSIDEQWVILISELKKLREEIKKLDTEAKQEFWKTVIDISPEKFGTHQELRDFIRNCFAQTACRQKGLINE